MRWTFTVEKLARLFSAAALVVGLGVVPATQANAARPCYNCQPPCYSYDGQTQHGLPPSENGAAADGQQDATDPLNQPQQNDIDFSQNQPAPSALDVAYSSGGSMIGRMDANARMNLFDSMSAVPRNRVWYSMLYASNYKGNFGESTGLGFDNAGAEADAIVYRAGAEVKLWDSASLSMQAQYLGWSGDTIGGISDPGLVSDSWSNPQFMFKQVIYADCDFVVSGIVGVTPQLRYSGTDIRDSTTRIFPGMLFFQQWSEQLFFYGGWQFGIATNSSNVDTYDWGFGTGYWVYQSCCCNDWLQRVSLQYEVFGKHVLGHRTVNDYFGSYGVPSAVADYQESRHVIDMTFGASFYIGQGIQFSSGISIPVTTTDVRGYELISTIGYNF